MSKTIYKFLINDSIKLVNIPLDMKVWTSNTQTESQFLQKAFFLFFWKSLFLYSKNIAKDNIEKMLAKLLKKPV